MNARVAIGLAGCVVVLALTGSPTAQARRIPSYEAVAAAKAYAEATDRTGAHVDFAAIDTRGRLHSRGGSRIHRSASQTKAMLLVAYLRRLGNRPLPPARHRVLAPMIQVSGNRAASRMHAVVGDAGLAHVGRLAGMRHLQLNGTWSDVGITAVDQARFFRRFDQLVPRRHRSYARRLLSSIVPLQSWGIPSASRRHALNTFFKGGWRRGLVNQGALLETGDRRRLSIVVLTDGLSFAAGTHAVASIARRLLRDTRPPGERARQRATWLSARRNESPWVRASGWIRSLTPPRALSTTS